MLLWRCKLFIKPIEVLVLQISHNFKLMENLAIHWIADFCVFSYSFWFFSCFFFNNPASLCSPPFFSWCVSNCFMSWSIFMMTWELFAFCAVCEAFDFQLMLFFLSVCECDRNQSNANLRIYFFLSLRLKNAPRQ